MSDDGHESWTFSWNGRAFRLGDTKVIVDVQLTEHEDIRMVQRHVLALGRIKRDAEPDKVIPVMLKIRYDIDPWDYDIEDIGEHRETTAEHVLFELELIHILAAAGHGPRLLKNCRSDQNIASPFPGLPIHFMIMERVPGEDVNKIRDHLEPKQLRSIKTQLAKILETMRLHNRCMDTEHPGCLRYDAATDRLYLVDLTHWGVMQSFDSPPITEDDDFVLAFGLWDDEEDDDEKQDEEEEDNEEEQQPLSMSALLPPLQSSPTVSPRQNLSPSRNVGSVSPSRNVGNVSPSRGRENMPPRQVRRPEDMEGKEED